jgi:preprotein translocase subunit SecD
MERALRWKTLFILVLVALSVGSLLPTVTGEEFLFFDKKVKLGLDLKGGLHLVYRVDLDKVIDDKAGELRRDLEAKLAEEKIAARVETPRPSAAAGVPLGAVFILAEGDPAVLKKVGGAFLDDYGEELTQMDCPGDRAGGVCLRVASDYAERIKESALEQAIRTIKDRIDRSGVAEPTIIKKGEDIIVELPGTDDRENDRLRTIINRTAQLEFKIVDDGTPFMQKLAEHVDRDPVAAERGISVEPDSWQSENSDSVHNDYYLTAKDRKELLRPEDAARYGCNVRDRVAIDGRYECTVTGRTILQEYLKNLPAELKIDENHQFGYEEVTPRTALLGARAIDKAWRTYYLHRTAELTGTAISKADVFWDPTTNRPEVLVQFNRHGARRFGDLTSKNVGRKMAIILDEKVTSAPIIQSAITGGRSTITMGGGEPRIVQLEAEDLVNVLRTGALPAPLVESQSSQIGALLGQDAIDRAKLSMIIGAALVILVMLYFFKYSGIIASLAMGLNVLFQMAVLSGFQATLTLPGIAGLVLTIGMAVDSNIIIFARIREELRSGKSVRGAVDAGFSRAFWTVFDANVTTFVAGFVLMEYGTGPIRGFAVMLLIGVVCNLFTSTWVSRLMFDFWIGRRKSATAALSI